MTGTTRTRSRITPEVHEEYDRQIRNYSHSSGQSFTQVQRALAVIPGFGDSIADTLTPNYYELKRSGSLLPQNPCHISKSDMGGSVSVTANHLFKYEYWQRGYLRWYKYDDLYKVVVTAPSPSLPNDFEGSKFMVDNAATNAALAALNGPIAQSLVTMGEFKKTIQTIIGIKKDIYSAVRKLIRKPKHKSTGLNTRRTYDVYSPRMQQRVENEYMRARYGIRPLVFDIQQHVEAFTSKARTGWRTVSRSRSDDRTRDFPEGVMAIGDVVYNITRYEKVTYRSKVTIPYTIDEDYYRSLIHRFGLDKFLSTVWELIPLSFAIDMFFNIGNTLSALEPHPGIKIGKSCISKTTIVETWREYEFSHITTADDPDHQWFGYPNSFKGPVGRVKTYSREKYSPSVKLPAFLPDLDFFQMLDLSILAKQLFVRQPRYLNKRKKVIR